MIKFFFAFFIILSCTGGIALCESSYFLSENDTLNKQYFDSLSYTTYSSPGGGFISGNNAYLDRAKAQEFHAGNLCNIIAVIINFGHKKFTSLSDSSYIGINFYDLNNTGRNTLVTNAPCPGNIFHTDSIRVADIDTTNGNILIYSNALYTDSNFAIGIDFDQLNSLDTIALFTNKDGAAGSREQSWELDEAGNWFTLKYNWPLNADYAIFPIVNTSVGLNVLSNKVQNISISPNPSAIGFTNINLSKDLIYDMQVYNSNMQLINSKLIGIDEKTASVKFEANSKGIYFIKIKTENQISIQKLIVY
jgi:hypothetical protein